MAQITISSDHKLNTIVQLAGAESGTGSYDGIDTLYVEGVTQEALDAALATYMADLDTYLLEPSREIRKVTISKASANFVAKTGLSDLNASSFVPETVPAFAKLLATVFRRTSCDAMARPEISKMFLISLIIHLLLLNVVQIFYCLKKKE